MIKVFFKEKKGKYEIIAVADHQKDLNNLRLMSYEINNADKVNLNKDEYGGPYLKLNCDDCKIDGDQIDVQKVNQKVKRLQEQYN